MKKQTRNRNGLRWERVRWVGGTALVFLWASALQAENRSADGTGNNLSHPTWGAAFSRVQRVVLPAYGDGVSTPAGENRPSARVISNALAAQNGLIPNDRNLTDWLWQWGQFIDHDITLSEFMVPTEPFDIAVPTGDPMFDPEGTGAVVIRLDRSIYDPATGTDPDNPRQQINEITSYIDASNVYGSDPQRAAWLRTGAEGKLKMSEANLLPFNDGTRMNVGPGGMPSTSTSLFVAGDVRANEQIGLTSLHTLFAREHNRLCDEIAAKHPDWTDEQIYQRTRKTVGALLQIITFNEFLPALLGPEAPPLHGGSYSPAVNATIANIFANGIYRLGHTLLSPEIMRLDAQGSVIPEGNLPLRDAFFQPERIAREGGIEPVLRGLAAKRMQEVDVRVVDDVRNFLFGRPGEGGFDLAALNIQRGRDHGLGDYNTVREAFGLSRVTSFAQITSDPDLQTALQSLYGSVDNIDVWVGAMAEDHPPGMSLGKLAVVVLKGQFTRLRNGDRFWYARDPDFTPKEIADLEGTKLSDVIRRNTDVANIQDDVFRMPEEQTEPPSEPTPPARLCGIMGPATLAFTMFGLLGMSRFIRAGRRSGTA